MDSAKLPDCFVPLGADDGEPASRPYIPGDARAGILALLGVFKRVCRDLNLEDGGSGPPAIIARVILEAALGGEDDLDKLYRLGLKSVSH